MATRIVRELPEKIWREYIALAPEANVFHTPEMFQVFARAKGYHPSLWAAVDDSNRPLALLLPVQVTMLGGLLPRFTTRAIAYGSIMCDAGDEGKDALAMLLQAYMKNAGNRTLLTEFRNLSDLQDLQPALAECGFVYEDHLNYLIDLDRPPEAVLQSIGKRTRKKIRRALRQEQVVVEEVNQRDQVQLCYELLKKTYVLAGVPLADRTLFEATFDVLHPQGMVKFLLAQVEDIHVASSVELVYKDTIYGWYGGMDRSYSEYIPNELLLWYIFKWGAENGFKRYDFGGAGTPDEEYGVRDFKAKFGGELVCYGRNTFVPSPVCLALSKCGYTIYQKLVGIKNRYLGGVADEKTA